MYSSDGNSYPEKETSCSHSPRRKSGYFIGPGRLLFITRFSNSFGCVSLYSNEEESSRVLVPAVAFDCIRSNNAPARATSLFAGSATTKDIAHAHLDIHSLLDSFPSSIIQSLFRVVFSASSSSSACTKIQVFLFFFVEKKPLVLERVRGAVAREDGGGVALRRCPHATTRVDAIHVCVHN